MRVKMIPVAAVAALFLAACGASGDTPEATTPATGAGTPSSAAARTEVAIQAFEFRPGEIEVSVGDTVTWTNEDDILHTVTSGKAQEQGVPGVTEDSAAEPDGSFDQEVDGAGATFDLTFDEAGEFPYFCAIHPGMTGVVIVE